MSRDDRLVPLFLSTLSLRRATVATGQIKPGSGFLSTLSLRRATGPELCQFLRALISIHALLAESDNFRRSFKRSISNFYPRSPCGERREPTALRTPHQRFLSTLSLRRATAVPDLGKRNVGISIHALLAESDKDTTARQQIADISIHALLAESDWYSSRIIISVLGLISIHALLAESDILTEINKMATGQISIHALLAESDILLRRNADCNCHFYPRSPCGERLVGAVLKLQRIYDFYPRSPCGERLRRTYQQGGERAFLSTLSLRRATPAEHRANSQQEFLSTLSLRRATAVILCISKQCRDFYPRSPCGERRPPAPPRREF